MAGVFRFAQRKSSSQCGEIGVQLTHRTSGCSTSREGEQVASRTLHDRRKLGRHAAVIAVSALVVAGCSSSGASTNSGASGSASSPGGDFALSVGVLHAFTGPNAFFGKNAQVSCQGAAQQINAAGGIMGHQLTCANYDTKGDPADAVPVTNRMLVSEPHLAMVLGPDGNDIPSVIPLLEAAKIPEMNTVGDPRYDQQTSKYFWRLTASDSTQAPALAYYAAHAGAMQVGRRLDE